MRGVSRIVRGVAVLSVVVSLSAPMQARPTGRDAGRWDRDVVKIVQKWLAKVLSVISTGDGLTDPHP